MRELKKGNITRRLILSYCLLISIFISYDFYAIYDINIISSLTRIIYNHPLIVSNASLQANISILKIHRDMKDVVLFDSSERIRRSIDNVNTQEKQVYRYLDVVRNTILGDQGKRLENEARILFGAWRPIREEVISLVHTGQRTKAADITFGRGADHVAKLEEKMLGLMNYARAKAASFLKEAEKTHSRIKITSIVFLLSGIFASLLIAIFTLKRTESAENELRESRQLLVNAIDFAPIGMVLIEPEGRYYKANKAFSELTGYSNKELAKMTYQDLTHPDDYGVGPEVVQKLLRGEIDRASFEKRYVRKDGGIIHVSLTTSLLKDKTARPLYLFTQIQDITERKRSEDELKKYSERLEEMVRERTRELQDAQEQLIRKEKLSVLGQLAGGVGHELRNPLGVISNAVYYLKMVLPDADENIKEYLETISLEVERSSKIISVLLDFSRVKSMDKEKITITDLVSRALEKQPAPEDIEVVIDIPSDIPPVYVDALQIGQVFGNLVTNACQAMPEGGNLTIEAKVKQKAAHVSITDTGCGIPEDNLEKLFEPLFTTKARGIGLGLAVSKNLTEANGGSIEVKSDEGRGSTFTVILPFNAAA